MPKVFSVTIDDCIVDTFRSGGKGGQHQNKTETGVRIVHPPSGAVGESRNERSQYLNKRIAFRRMAESDKFRAWCRMEVARRTGTLEEVEKMVEKSMTPSNLRIEVKVDGRWVEENNINY